MVGVRLSAITAGRGLLWDAGSETASFHKHLIGIKLTFHMSIGI